MHLCDLNLICNARISFVVLICCRKFRTGLYNQQLNLDERQNKYSIFSIQYWNSFGNVCMHLLTSYSFSLSDGESFNFTMIPWSYKDQWKRENWTCTEQGNKLTPLTAWPKSLAESQTFSPFYPNFIPQLFFLYFQVYFRNAISDRIIFSNQSIAIQKPNLPCILPMHPKLAQQWLQVFTLERIVRVCGVGSQLERFTLIRDVQEGCFSHTLDHCQHLSHSQYVQKVIRLH